MTPPTVMVLGATGSIGRSQWKKHCVRATRCAHSCAAPQGHVSCRPTRYEGVRDILAFADASRVRVPPMTPIGVTDRLGNYNRTNEAMTGSDGASG
ncbi:MAG: hypothetical protein ACRYFY_15525 [Janthinobacterium lividum]